MTTTLHVATPHASAPMARALALSLAVHAAAMVAAVAWMHAPTPPAASGATRMWLLRMDGAAGRAEVAPVASRGAAAPHVEPHVEPHVQRLAPVMVTARREPHAGARAPATARPTSAPSMLVESPQPIERTGASAGADIAPRADVTAPIVGVRTFAGFGDDGFGTGSGRFLRTGSAAAPLPSPVPVAARSDWSPQRAALEAQIAEARAVGALFTELREAWIEVTAATGQCDVLRAEVGAPPLTTCDATAALATIDAMTALLARFACVRFTRDAAGARVGPCPDSPAAVAQVR